MNITQKQSILNSIEQILAFDFDTFISQNNESGNLEEIKFGEYSVSEFKYTYLKVFRQLKIELEEGIGLMLPNQEVFNNEFGSATLDAESINFLSYIASFPHRNSAADILKRFVYYQILIGFWDKSMVKQHSIDLQQLNQAKEELSSVQKNLTRNLKVFEQLKAQFENQVNDFAAVLSGAQDQTSEITKLLEQSKSESLEISDLLSNANSSNTEISLLTSNINSKLVTVTNSISDYKKAFSQIEKDNKLLSEQLKEDLSIADENLKESKNGNAFIESKKEEIIKLVGLAADGSLGYKFNSRKEDLEKAMRNFWRYAVPGSIIIALGWVIVVFTVLSANLGNIWINLLVNVIKTTPAWILVGFIFAQYSKERNLQEEYAFKSAIAMTLTSYSEMLSEVDGATTKVKSSKQEMLLESIKNLYTQPALLVEKEKTDLNSKQLIDSLKSITDMVKNIRS